MQEMQGKKQKGRNKVQKMRIPYSEAKEEERQNKEGVIWPNAQAK
jgi:hypothetical protein